MQEYKRVTSPPVKITPLDLGPKYADKLGSGVHEYCKTYGEKYCVGQLMFWHTQNAEPDASLTKASTGCLSLPDVCSFYAKVQKPSRQLVYGRRMMKFMLARMVRFSCTLFFFLCMIEMNDTAIIQPMALFGAMILVSKMLKIILSPPWF